MSAQRPVIQRPIRPAPGPHRTKVPKAARRLITFAVLVSVSLGSLMLFSDSTEPVRGSSRTDIPDSPGVVAGESETTVVLGLMDFDISNLIEVEPGRFERRVEYKIRFEEGRPESDGFFKLLAPHITLMNPLTQTVRGEVSAKAGRCRTNQSTTGNIGISTSGLSLEAFSLSGDVDARYLMDDGSEVTLQAEQLDQEGDQLTAPGQVVWARQGVSLAGRDMLWEQASGRLEFGSDTVISLDSPDGGLSGTLRGAGGLIWQQRPPSEGGDTSAATDASGLGYGSLRGPVTGELSDGSSLKAGLLAIDGDATSLTLSEQAVLEQVLPDGGLRRALAEHITVVQDESGELSLLHAQDGVRLEQVSEEGEVSWLEAPTLTELGRVVSASGLVRWGRGNLTFSGRDLTLDETSRQLSYVSDVTMEIPADAPSPLAGMSFSSPGGMTWLLPENSPDPWAEALGRFTGTVSGQTPNGLAFRCDSLVHDGPGGLLLLTGAVHAEQDQGGRRQLLDAARLDLALDQASSPVDLLARGDVEIRWSSPQTDDGAKPGWWSLSAQQLRVLGDRVLVAGPVTATQEGFSLAGMNLTFDSSLGHLELERAVVVNLADGSVIRSPSGLVWDQPDPLLGIDQGSGVLRGPATGENDQGLSFRSDVIELDGRLQLVALVGDAQVNLPANRVINAERLNLWGTTGGRRVEAPELVQWRGPLSTGSGVGLTYDMADRLLAFSQDVAISFLDLTGDKQLDLNSKGSLSWQGPADETLPLWFGAGEIREGVTAVTGAGQRFTTDLLQLDGSSGRFDLIGPSQVSLPQVRGLGDLSANERITLLQDVNGEVIWLDAYGDVSGTVGSTDESFEYGAEALLFDRDAKAVVLDGESRMERVRDGKTVGLRGDAKTRLISVFDDLGALISLAGEGRISSNMGSFVILSDSLNWDVPEDYMVLTGNCRVLRFGGEVDTAMVEVWPSAWRWHVHPPASATGDG